jgi:DNA-binding CsgD family transcriptional regulator
MGVSNAMIYCSDDNKNRVIEFEQTAYEMNQMDDYKVYYHTNDPWGKLWNKVPLDHAYPNFDVVDIQDFKKSEFYADFWKNLGFLHTCGGVFLRDESFFGIACFQLYGSSSKYPKYSVERLQLLMPHFRRALQVQHRITSHATQKQTLENTIEQLPYGAILIRSNLKVASCNKKAGHILEKGYPLSLIDNKLFCRNNRVNETLQRIIKEYISNPVESKEQEILIPNKDSGFYLLYLYPFRTNDSLHDEAIAKVSLAIFIIDSKNIPVPDASFINSVLGISPVESVIAKGLIEGKNPEILANERNVSINTVRSQIKSIFRKTKTNSKSVLINKIHNIHRLNLK